MHHVGVIKVKIVEQHLNTLSFGCLKPKQNGAMVLIAMCISLYAELIIHNRGVCFNMCPGGNT